MTTKRSNLVPAFAGTVAALLVAGFAIFAPSTASADEIFTEGASISVSPSVAQPGQPLTVTVTAPPFGGMPFFINVWPAGSDYWASDNPDRLWYGSATSSAEGVATFSFPAPSFVNAIEIWAWVEQEPISDDIGWVTVPVASVPNPGTPEDPAAGTNETPTGGIALPGGGDSIAAGNTLRARVSAGADEDITLTVTLPGGAVPGITVAGTSSLTVRTDGAGNAFFNVHIPRATPAGIGTVVGTNAGGYVVYESTFRITGRAVHPAAG